MTSNAEAQRIYDLWDRYASEGRIDELVALYTEDATFESPLVSHLMARESGICRGRGEISAYFKIGFERRPHEVVSWYRSGRYFFDGVTLIWEYPGQAPDFEQLDLAQVLELRDGLIVRHRVYWGYRGVSQLLHSAAAQRERSTEAS
jgi:hypothetical protein